MNLELKDKTALIIGSSQGIGFGIAKELSKEGCIVCLAGRNEEKLKAAAFGLPPSTQYVVLDLNNIEDTKTAINELCANLSIDILINNCGGPPPKAISSVDNAEWLSHFESIVLATIQITNLLLPKMIKSNWGRIINLTSSGVIQPIPNLGISNTLRSSILGWSKTLAHEVASYGITVNCIIPGKILTQRLKALDENTSKSLGLSEKQVRLNNYKNIPIGWYGTVNEVASLVAFLSSSNASYITGSAIRIDGGMISSI